MREQMVIQMLMAVGTAQMPVEWPCHGKAVHDGIGEVWTTEGEQREPRVKRIGS
jgi:hypothetical protein